MGLAAAAIAKNFGAASVAATSRKAGKGGAHESQRRRQGAELFVMMQGMLQVTRLNDSRRR